MDGFHSNENWIRHLQKIKNLKDLRKIQGNRFFLNPPQITRPKITPDTFQSPYPNNKQFTRKTNGLVLVFDLDETIAKFTDIGGNSSKINNLRINPTILDILKKATQAKETGVVDAILLLTNNNSGIYITQIEFKIGDDMPSGDFAFDDMMKRDDSRRYDTSNIANKVKHIEDVKRMLLNIGKSVDNLSERVYFFDDIHDHEIGKYIPYDHYIKITPRYDPETIDKTDYSAVYRALGLPYEQLGGRAKKAKKTRKGKKVMRRRRTAKK